VRAAGKKQMLGETCSFTITALGRQKYDDGWSGSLPASPW
jgi:hypothetical protein